MQSVRKATGRRSLPSSCKHSTCEMMAVNLSESALAISSRSSARAQRPLKSQNHTSTRSRNGTKPARARADRDRSEREEGRPPTADEVLDSLVPRPQHPPLRRTLPLAAALPLLPRHLRLPKSQPTSKTLGPESQLSPQAATSGGMWVGKGEGGANRSARGRDARNFFPEAAEQRRGREAAGI